GRTHWDTISARHWLTAVGVQYHVVARLRDSGLHVALKLGSEAQRVAGGRRHAANESRRFRPAGQLEPDPGCIDLFTHNDTAIKELPTAPDRNRPVRQVAF